jgi:hypothetical protein
LPTSWNTTSAGVTLSALTTSIALPALGLYIEFLT